MCSFFPDVVAHTPVRWGRSAAGGSGGGWGDKTCSRIMIRSVGDTGGWKRGSSEAYCMLLIGMVRRSCGGELHNIGVGRDLVRPSSLYSSISLPRRAPPSAAVPAPPGPADRLVSFLDLAHRLGCRSALIIAAGKSRHAMHRLPDLRKMHTTSIVLCPSFSRIKRTPLFELLLCLSYCAQLIWTLCVEVYLWASIKTHMPRVARRQSHEW